MNTEHFKTYSAQDFIFDEEFRSIVRELDGDIKINELMELMPEKRYEINLAVKVIKGLHVHKFQQQQHRKNELWNQIISKKQKNIRLIYLKYAAAIILLFGTSSTIYFYTVKNNTSKFEANNTTVEINQLSTNFNDALLVLANGKTIAINSKESTVKYSSDGSGITLNDSAGVGQNVQESSLNKLIVPYGKRSVITLSDGTKVWLNAGSTLVFPPAFKGKTREVQLFGEAYFDVTHNKEKPFYVKTDAFKMKVYGTKFNIQAYNHDLSSSIVLVEGKVSMMSNKDTKSKEVFLAPSQKATIVDGSANFQIDNVENLDIYTSWTQGYLTFANEDLGRLLKQVSRYYDVDIDNFATENTEKIYGKLDLKDDLESVLNGISFISKTTFKKVGNKYVFYQ